MDIQFLFDSAGNWIAFRKDKFIYDTFGHFFAWLPWQDNDVVTTNGEYFGTIFPKNRIYKLINHPYRGYPGYPGFAGFSPRPSGTIDVVVPKNKP